MSFESPSVAVRRYFPHVNLLRGFAALSVLVYHVIEHYGWQSFPTGYGLIWFKIGWMSVDLFFVISGFVIGWSLISLHNRQSEFVPLAKEFIWRRAGRIVPLYLLTMVVFAIAVQPNLLSPSTWVHWLAHITFTHPFLQQTFGSINGVNWSVGVEVHFYIFALLTSVWWVRRNPLTLLVTGILVAWALRAIAWLVADYFGLKGSQIFNIMVQMPMMLDEFAAGIALALFINRYPFEKWPGKLWQQGVVLALLAIGAVMVSLKLYWLDAGYWHNPNMVVFWRSSIAIAFALVIAFFVWLPPFKQPSLPYRALYYIGDISYGIYLWHLSVILLLKPYLIGKTELYLWVVIPCVLLLSAASWHWVEKPMIKWSKQKSQIT